MGFTGSNISIYLSFFDIRMTEIIRCFFKFDAMQQAINRKWVPKRLRRNRPWKYNPLASQSFNLRIDTLIVSVVIDDFQTPFNDDVSIQFSCHFMFW